MRLAMLRPPPGLHDDDGTELAPAVAGDFGARQQRDLAIDLPCHRVGERARRW